MTIYWRLTSLPELDGLPMSERRELLRKAGPQAIGGPKTTRSFLVLGFCITAGGVFGAASGEPLFFAFVFGAPGTIYWHKIYSANIRAKLRDWGYPKAPNPAFKRDALKRAP